MGNGFFLLQDLRFPSQGFRKQGFRRQGFRKQGFRSWCLLKVLPLFTVAGTHEIDVAVHCCCHIRSLGIPENGQIQGTLSSDTPLRLRLPLSVASACGGPWQPLSEPKLECSEALPQESLKIFGGGKGGALRAPKK